MSLLRLFDMFAVFDKGSVINKGTYDSFIAFQ